MKLRDLNEYCLSNSSSTKNNNSEMINEKAKELAKKDSLSWDKLSYGDQEAYRNKASESLTEGLEFLGDPATVQSMLALAGILSPIIVGGPILLGAKAKALFNNLTTKFRTSKASNSETELKNVLKNIKSMGENKTLPVEVVEAINFLEKTLTNKTDNLYIKKEADKHIETLIRYNKKI